MSPVAVSPSPILGTGIMQPTTTSPTVPQQPIEAGQKYECRTCGSNYSRLEYLKRHERKHQDIRPFKCPKCAKEFARSDVLLRHRRRQHPDDPTLPPALNTSSTTAATSNTNASPTLISPLSGTTASPVSPIRSRGRKRTNTNPSTKPSPPPAHTHTSSSPTLLGPFPVLSPPTTTASWDLSGSAQFPLAFDSAAVGGVTHDAYGFRTSVSSLGLLESWESFSGGGGGGGGAPTTAASVVASAYHNHNQGHSPSTSATSGSSALFHSSEDAALAAGGGSPPTSVSAGGASPTTNGFSTAYEDVVMDDGGESGEERRQVQALVNGGMGMGMGMGGMDVFLPEQTMLKIDGQRLEIIRGVCNRDPSDRFYVPPGFFAYCYQVPRWNLPRLSILCSLASRSLSGMLVHLPLVHEPTFRLANMPGPLAFAICSVGGVASMRGAKPQDLDEVASWGQEILPQVRIEKADMLVRNFHKQKKGMTRLEMLAVVQALLLYNAPTLMSSDDCDRLVGHLFLGTIVQIARQAGLFVPTAEHATASSLGTAMWLDASTGEPLVNDDAFLERKWKEWIQLETYRRAAFLVYILDTLSALESAIPAIVHPNHVAHIPLPAPDSLWAARSAREWAVAIAANPAHVQGKGVTLDEAMCECLRAVPDASTALSGGEVPAGLSAVEGERDPMDEPDEGGASPQEQQQGAENSRFAELGPFARIVVILTVVRGLITLGEGEKAGGPVTKRWALGGMQGGNRWSEKEVVQAYEAALQRWKKRWNADRLCPGPAQQSQQQQSQPLFPTPPQTQHSEPSPPDLSSASSASTQTSATAHNNPGPTPAHPASPQYALVNHASPYYWFAQMLISIMRSEIERGEANADGGKKERSSDEVRGEEARPNRFGGVDLRKMLFVAREYGLSNAP